MKKTDSVGFNYLTPLIFPLFPTYEGRLTIGLDLQKVFDIRAMSGATTETLTVSYRVYLNGQLTTDERVEIRVSAGRVDTPYLWRNYPAEIMGYVEVGITADRPVFRRIDLPVGYALLNIPDYGTLTLIPDSKFARPIIIEQIEATKTFCLVHSASYFDKTADIGNSLLFINPYEQDIVVTVQANRGRRIRQRVRAKQALFLPVDRILTTQEWSCLMVTASNRISVWDVRHRAGDPNIVNRVDHLDVFRGNPVTVSLNPLQIIKLYIRRLARNFGRLI